MSEAQLELPARLEGAALAPLRLQLLEAGGSDLTLQGAGVERINGLGLQLLAAAALTRRAAGQRLLIADPSTTLAAALARIPEAFETTEE
ncbi:MAG: STAS domain-containing protein [Phenylobacterium sp.]|uniref:STAS domain-containing protein n=1 Tax=Phenylobacterium sp. TaxID=1871053 RepID=UPI001A3BEDF8|nr:STAS domain-containing protein [Phenylobacterium sp.]MBL8774019.1 STAS domain-containing protein [Phenylobacterium sp.]